MIYVKIPVKISFEKHNTALKEAQMLRKSLLPVHFYYIKEMILKVYFILLLLNMYNFITKTI